MNDDLRKKLALIEEEAKNKRNLELDTLIEEDTWAEDIDAQIVEVEEDENIASFDAESSQDLDDSEEFEEDSFFPNRSVRTVKEIAEEDKHEETFSDQDEEEIVYEQPEEPAFIFQTNHEEEPVDNENVEKQKNKKSRTLKDFNFSTFINAFMIGSLIMMTIFALVSLGVFSSKDKTETFKTEDFIYNGQVKNGVYNGPATVTFKDGSVLKGNFSGGKLNGKFDYTGKNKSTVSGTVDKDIDATIVLDGGQKLSYKNGKFETDAEKFNYFGAWDIHGLTYKGKVKFENGAEYDGDFALGIPNGDGTYSAIDGQILKGYFVNGVINEDE